VIAGSDFELLIREWRFGRQLSGPGWRSNFHSTVIDRRYRRGETLYYKAFVNLGGKSQRSVPEVQLRLISKRATPAFEILILPPVSSSMTPENSGSWPTTMTDWASRLASRRRNRSELKPCASAGSTCNSMPRRWPTISAVCEARGRGLVKMESGMNFKRSRNLATRLISLRPRSVRGRSSSGFVQFGQSASPWRRKQSFMMLAGKTVGQAFPPPVSN
jgi:hypothetical protein